MSARPWSTFAGPGDDGPLGTRVVAEVARRKNVPVIVDAAAEILTLKPNVHLERGAIRSGLHPVVNASAGRRPRGCFLGEKNWFEIPRGPTARRTTLSGGPLKLEKKRIMACWLRWKRG